ncbi:hypothetical protein C4552_04385 [Candidatus Parcubacteria bacterium]|nr:MAG: hypothetical protein C4552_04385 [Candidatus Parcubacteria bacterium]
MNRTSLITLAALVAILGGAAVWYAQNRTDAAERDDAAVRSRVEEFGRRLASVPLLAPADAAAAAMEEQYREFVAPDLLAAWQREPLAAPGRLTSSPWPDRIEITGLDYAPPGVYTVRGNIVEVTSADIASGSAAAVRRPVTLIVEWRGGRWLITGFTSESALPEGWQALDHEGIRFAYPPGFSVRTGADLGGGFVTPTIARADAPASAFDAEQTNLIDAAFVIAARPGADSACLSFADAPQPPNEDAISEGTINGVAFMMYRTVGAAAGNRYVSELFRTVQNGRCYEIALVVHTGNIGNYPPDTVAEFDERRAFDVLERMLDSLRLPPNQ